jgi:hypothetical protein
MRLGDATNGNLYNLSVRPPFVIEAVRTTRNVLSDRMGSIRRLVGAARPLLLLLGLVMHGGRAQETRLRGETVVAAC